MFERNPIDNLNASAIAVEITCQDGTIIVGRAALDNGKSVHQLLAGDGNFLYVEGPDGDGDFVAKSSIKGLKVIKPVQPRALRQPSQTGGTFDPARVLGVDRQAPWDEIHSAYRKLAKLYHPDRYAGVELPSEVAAYLDGKAKQVNQAFRMLKSERSARS